MNQSIALLVGSPITDLLFPEQISIFYFNECQCAPYNEPIL